MGWKYNAGLGFIGIFVFIWVGSAEMTQKIFVEYEQPFAITYLGVSLMVIFLPLSILRDWVSSILNKITSKNNNLVSDSSIGLDAPLLDDNNRIKVLKNHTINCDIELDVKEEEEEEEALTLKNHELDIPILEESHNHQSWKLMKCCCYLAPIWFATEYLSNSALANTSVASTTVLTSTSGLFTLIFGSLIGQDSINVAKIIAVLVSMTGAALTTIGKTWARDQKLSISESTTHSIKGDIYGLISAVLYGLFTVLLKRIVESDGHKADTHKALGYIGLFTAISLWWLIWPLNYLDIEPHFQFPKSSSTAKLLLINGLIGSVVSDYLWAISVIWTSPIVATLGMSLTIPVAMVADMLIHGRNYSAVYILGCIQVFAGFVIANLSDNYSCNRVSVW